MTTLEAATQQQPVILGPGEGTPVELFGNPMLVRVSREATNNQLWMAEYTVTPNFGGPPPHVHRRTHEIFYVLEGELGMLAGDEHVVVKAAGLVMVPPGVRHTFYNKRSEPCRFIGITTPGDLGAYLEGLPAVIAQYGFPTPPDISAALAEKYDGGIFSTAP